MPAVIIGLFFLLWQLVSRLLGSPLLPPFTGVLANMAEGNLLSHAAASLFRLAAGIVPAFATGIPMGILAGRTKTGRRIINPPVYIMYPVPKTALIPAVVLLLGIGELSKILLVYLAVVFQITVSIRDASSAVPSQYIDSLRSLGCSRIHLLRYVYLPAGMPQLFSTLRISLGIAAAVLFFAEYFGTVRGLGYFIMDARTRMDFLDLYSGITALSLIMLSLFLFTGFLERRICRWNRN